MLYVRVFKEILAFKNISAMGSLREVDGLDIKMNLASPMSSPNSEKALLWSPQLDKSLY